MCLIVVNEVITEFLAIISNNFTIIVVYLLSHYSLIVVLFGIYTPKLHLN